MKSVNRVTLLGNVGKDAEVKFAGNGTAVATFSLATAERFKDENGEWQDRPEWHNLVAFGKTAEIVRDYVRKGSKLYVEGSLSTNSWDDKQSGQKRYKNQVKIESLILLDGRDKSEQQSSRGYSNQQNSYAQDAGERESLEITDADIPF